MDEGFEHRIQRLAEAHLEACYDAMEEETESPAVAPFDGCITCVVREVLSVTWEELQAEAHRGGVRVVQ